MKKIKIILSAVIVIIGMSVSAQWNTNGNHIYNTNSGNVGIGTSNPILDLTISKAENPVYVQLESAYDGTGILREIGGFLVKNSTTGDMLYYGLRKNNNAHDMVQSVYDANTSTWRQFTYFNFGTRKYEMQSGIHDAQYTNTGNLIFNNGGGVVIGNTTVPTGVKLAVNGKITATEVEVTLDAWADHVFNQDYKLLPLSEVEEFIKKNKHLPGVPSEKQIIEEGLSLGEMNKDLMKKVEELTLYVIQLKKEIDVLKEE
jgi:hypothetical protein